MNSACTNSRCKYVGSPDLTENLQDIKLSNTELEFLTFALKFLTFGLKFPTVIRKRDLIGTIIKIHRENDTDFTKYLSQRINTAIIERNNITTQTLTNTKESNKNMMKFTFPPGKREGVTVLMNRNSYDVKINLH